MTCTPDGGNSTVMERDAMESGLDFLRSQVGNAVVMHRSFLAAVDDHAVSATDERFRDLCARHVGRMREHQRMLESYQAQLGGSEGLAKRTLGQVFGVVRNLADTAQENDFMRLAGDIVMARQAEEIFKTFRDAGRTLGLAELSRLGEMGERHHDEYGRDANRLIQQMFVERARGAETSSEARLADVLSANHPRF